MLKIKKVIINIYKLTIYKLFKLIYGDINSVLKIGEKETHQKKIIINDNEYNIYFCNSCRLYTDRVHDTAIIKNNSIINGPSFQYRSNKNVDCKFNSVLEKGTPRLKKKIKGKVLSLLTGGGGNSNYWHWLFDVIPRFYIIDKYNSDLNIDFYLFPNLDKKFQKETLDILKIPEHKRLSSKKYRHFETDQIIVTAHPYNILNDPMSDSLNIPNWIFDFLRKKFLNQAIKNKSSQKDYPKKIYINRKDGTTKKWRYIINESDVESNLEKKGFKSLTLENYSFLDQVNIFYNAKEVVGLHGAGFANIVFCKPNTKILELRSNSAGDMFKNLALSNKLIYNDISLDPKTINYNNQAGDIEIDINLLNSILKI